MTPSTILILGGYGNTGRPLARLLLQESDVHLVVAGRNAEKAAALADELNQAYPGGRVTAARVDAADPASLAAAFNGISMVVVASSTAQFVRQVAEAALAAGSDYLDVQYSTSKVAYLQSIQSQIEAAGRCFITDGGFHPGLPGALIRYAIPQFDLLDMAVVGSVIKIDWAGLELGEATANELVEELNNYTSLVYKDGGWKPTRWSSTADFISMDFDAVFKNQYAAPMFLEELRHLPDQAPGCRQMGFYVGGFNWFVDWLVMPLGMAALKLAPRRAIRPVGRLMLWGLQAFSRPPYGVLLKLEAQGLKDGQAKRLELLLSHPDGYVFTAVPVVACLLQYLEDSRRRPGLWTQAEFVDPSRFLDDLQRMGIQIR